MKILIVGGGGREHSIAKKCRESHHKPIVFIAPGNAGTADCGTNIPIKDTDIHSLLEFAKKESIDYTFVGPEAPLVEGIVDVFNKHNLPIIGPTQEAAQLEGSKSWAKAFMKRHNIPTASYNVFTNFEEASSFIKKNSDYPIVIKADGLAAGKGVTVAESETQALTALRDCFLNNKFSKAGQQVVIESFLEGEEASIFAFTDGKTIIPMLPAQDHKTLNDGDKGPNTGGMGAYCPAPIVTTSVLEFINENIFKPLLEGFQKDGITYKGIVYAGLMVKDEKASIVEFNVRLGDPETQIVLPLLKTDFIDILISIHNETLSNIKLEWSSNSAVCVVLASGGYPEGYEKGKIITGLNDTFPQNTHAIHAGTQIDESGNIVTSGGRVMGIISEASTLKTAITSAYQGVSLIHFDQKTYRTDIGFKGITQ